MAVFDNNDGDDRFIGSDDQYDQVDYVGSLLDYTFTQNPNGTVTVTHSEFGTDTLSSIEGFWFGGEGAWYSLEDAIRLTSSNSDTGVFTDANGTIVGNTANNQMIGNGQNNVFYADRGDDFIDGNGGDYNQVDYDGALVEYTFTLNADGSVTASHATWGVDTLVDIDGFWFIREQAWYSIEDAIAASEGQPTFRLDDDGVLNGTPGDDDMFGGDQDELYYGGTGDDYIDGGDGFDQVNFDGSLSDYTVTRNGDGSYTFDHPVWGTDTLVDIEGLWFAGEAQWYAVDDGLLA